MPEAFKNDDGTTKLNVIITAFVAMLVLVLQQWQSHIGLQKYRRRLR